MFKFLKQKPKIKPPSDGATDLEQSTERLRASLDTLAFANGPHRYNAATRKWIESRREVDEVQLTSTPTQPPTPNADGR
jgi:hypothetical protein